MKTLAIGLTVLFAFVGTISVASESALAAQLSVKDFIPYTNWPDACSPVARVYGIALSPDESKLYAAYWCDTSSDHLMKLESRIMR